MFEIWMDGQRERERDTLSQKRPFAYDVMSLHSCGNSKTSCAPMSNKLFTCGPNPLPYTSTQEWKYFLHTAEAGTVADGLPAPPLFIQLTIPIIAK